MEFSMLHRYLIFSFVYWYNRQVLLLLYTADDMYGCIELLIVCTATTYLQQSNMDQTRSKVAKPARGQLNREIKCPCRCIHGKYTYT